MDNAYCTTIGMDVSDRTTKVCVMAKERGTRRILEETTIPTTRDGLRAYLSGKCTGWPVVFETGTHCRWMKREVESLGMKARDLLVKVRTMHVNELRGFAKSMGFRLPSCPANKAHRQGKAGWPEDFESLAWPLMDMLETIDLKIRAYESQIKSLAESGELKDKIGRVREVYGIGLLSGAALVASIDADPGRFRKARDAGAYFGLVPKQRQSGEMDVQCHITRAGSGFVRRLMIEAAQIAMRETARDTDVKLKGHRICARGGKIAKKRALVAMARCLVVTAVALLKKPDAEYVPLSERARREFEAMRSAEMVA